MSDEVRLSATTVNAPDALALANFYAELRERGQRHERAAARQDVLPSPRQPSPLRPAARHA
jgi:hypothetical protein